MEYLSPYLAWPALLSWTLVLLLPWRPWSMREQLAARPAHKNEGAVDLSGITVLIPARNEADVLEATLRALAVQGSGLKVLVVDDQSDDGTAAVAARFDFVQLLRGGQMASGWAGKLWALEQGLAKVDTGMVLLLDADIELRAGMLASLLRHKQSHDLHLVSVMADLQRRSVWEKLLLPAFVYFFKLIYPFSLSNSRRFKCLAAAAGGCILVDLKVLKSVGAFASIKDALIDDCALARQVKQAGYRTWIGLSRDVVSLRAYEGLQSIWQMVARSAFTQLHYSSAMLLLVTLIMLAVFVLPIAALFSHHPVWGLSAWLMMAVVYMPTLRYYELPLAWSLCMPLIGSLYLAMTWHSAVRYWRGTQSIWKGRRYARS